MTCWLCLAGACALGQVVDGPRGTTTTVAAAAGEVLGVEAWKTGGAFKLTARDASGAEAASVTWPDPPVISLSWSAAREGRYTVECDPAPGTQGACELAVLPSGADAPASNGRPEVEAALRSGHASLREWSPSGTRSALRQFEESVERSRALGLADLEVDSLLGLAEAREVAGEARQAAGLLEAAVAKAEGIGDGRRLVLASARLSSSLALVGSPDRAGPHLETALGIAREQGFLLGIAQLQLGQGDVHYARSELAPAEREYAAALAAFTRLGNRTGVIDSHLGIAYTLADLSQDLPAKEHLERARDLASSAGDRRREAIALRVLGQVLAKMTEEAAAIHCFESARTLFEAADDRVALVALYNGLGEVHGRLNDLVIAVQYHEKAEALAAATGLRLEEGYARFQAAKWQRRMGRLEAAASSFARARVLFDAVGDQKLSGLALAGLGNVAAAEGRPDVGLRQLQEALGAVRGIGETRLSAGILGDIAEIHLGLGRPQPARDAASEAVRLAVAARDPLRESRSRFLLARAARMEGNLDEAQRLVEHSLEIGEDVRARVPGGELRALFFEELDERYRFYVDLLMERERARPEAPFEELALAAAERGRARVLLDRFRRHAATPDHAERVARERELREEIRLLALDEDLGTRPAAEAGEPSLEEKLAELRRLQSVATAGRSESDRFDSARIEEIRDTLAVDGTLLVELCLGPERSYLWTIGQGRLVARTLPSREVIESLAKDVYTLLTGRQHEQPGLPSQRRARADEQDARFHARAAGLSRMLLGPIEDLDDFRRLIVVTDGLLNYVPLAALPHPRGGDGADYRPLVLSHEVVRAPSLAAMVAIAERSATRQDRAHTVERGPRVRIAVLADPVFTADDPRVVEPRRGVALGDPQRSAAAAGMRGADGSLANLPRLLASRDEASSIARAAPGTHVTITTDFDVDRARAEAALAGAFQVVHFATHGILNDEHPLLSGIVASLVDEAGHDQDGFLRAQDVYDFRVSAELVVLSACETGLGRLLRGEGITGLVHALLHAGADTVIASDWRVDDAATQELMAELYRGLFVDGTSVSAALRAAQVRLLRRRGTRAPFFWAAFEAHGLASRFEKR